MIILSEQKLQKLVELCGKLYRLGEYQGFVNAPTWYVDLMLSQEPSASAAMKAAFDAGRLTAGEVKAIFERLRLPYERWVVQHNWHQVVGYASDEFEDLLYGPAKPDEDAPPFNYGHAHWMHFCPCVWKILEPVKEIIWHAPDWQEIADSWAFEYRLGATNG